jgi:hypothetical protein
VLSWSKAVLGAGIRASPIRLLPWSVSQRPGCARSLLASIGSVSGPTGRNRRRVIRAYDCEI